MLRNIFLIIALALLANVAYAQNKNSTSLIAGQDFSYMLTAPKGWVADSESGRSQGLSFVFYPVGSSWSNGVAVMYATNNPKDENGGTLEKFITVDIADFKANSKTLKVTKSAPLITQKDAQGKKHQAEIRYFTGDKFGNFEAIAYIDAGKTIISIILNSHTKKDFDNFLPAFKEMVGSYYFLTDKVKVDQ